METLRDRMEADLKIGCYSPGTRKIYLLYARPEAGIEKYAQPAATLAPCMQTLDQRSGGRRAAR